MKKVMITILIIIAIGVIGMLLIRVKEPDTDITNKATKVGCILNGKIDDGSWSESHYKSMEITAKELNLDMVYHEDTPEGEECIEVIESMVADGCKIIIANSFGFGSYMEEMSNKYPEIYFLHAAGGYYSENFCSYFGRIYQMRYLCGIVAGCQTKTNKIGYVAAFDIPEVVRGIDAFTLGVRTVNPEATVYVDYCNSWISDELAEESLYKILDKQDIDIITVHTDSLRCYEIAEESNIGIIGYNLDNVSRYPDNFLTAAVWNWDVFYTDRIKEILQNKFKGKHYWNGIETNMIDIAPLTDNVEASADEYLQEAKQKLRDGYFDVFMGPIYDNEGTLRVKENENLSDQVLLEELNWYVEGVELINE